MPERAARRRLLRSGAKAGAGATLGRAITIAIGSLAVSPARAATIVAVRIWPARDYTRVTLELDKPLRATQLLLSDPPRLVVDLEGLEIDLALRQLIAKVQPDDPYIRQVRIGQNRPQVARVVLDLKSEVDPQLFTLQPVGNYQYRLVLDLYPMARIDPLHALLDQMRNAPAPPASGPLARSPDAGDPLAELLREQLAGETGKAPPAGQAPASPAVPSIAQGPAASPRAALPAPLPPAGPHGPAKRRPDSGPAMRRLVTIAIDAGHGGEDPGAIGQRGTREKDVVLQIAQRLRERIQAEPGMRPYLTRDGDYFVPLATRVEKARRVQADLMVSIHADAFVQSNARGASVYVLSERGASSSAARWLARRENASDLIGGVNLNSRNAEVRQVLLDLSTTAQIRQSSLLGSNVLTELGDVGRLHKPRIEQAGFAVLKAPDIPSILVETAFISNPDEERRLADPRYQARLADAIFRGIRAWVTLNPPDARGRST